MLGVYGRYLITNVFARFSSSSLGNCWGGNVVVLVFLIVHCNPYYLSRTEYLNCFKARSNNKPGPMRGRRLCGNFGQSCWNLLVPMTLRTAALQLRSCLTVGWHPMELKGSILLLKFPSSFYLLSCTAPRSPHPE